VSQFERTNNVSKKSAKAPDKNKHKSSSGYSSLFLMRRTILINVFKEAR
jgi:hypothetical protein